MTRYARRGMLEKIYVALFPCNECAKLIIQSGIEEVVYLSDKVGDQGKRERGVGEYRAIRALLLYFLI